VLLFLVKGLKSNAVSCWRTWGPTCCFALADLDQFARKGRHCDCPCLSFCSTFSTDLLFLIPAFILETLRTLCVSKGTSTTPWLYQAYSITVRSGRKHFICLKEAWRDGKGFEICTTGLEFESERVSFVKSWDNQCFTRSSGPIKYAFRGVGFPRIKKKKHFIVKKKKRTLIEIIARWDCPFSQPHFPLF